MSWRTRAVALTLACVVVAAGCGGGGGGSTQDAGSGIAGVVIERPVGRSHRQGPIDYQGEKPPSGGDHNPVWLNCGAYAEQPPNEFAVHSLEHGAVWITYLPDTLPADVNTLRGLADHSHVIVSPYAGLTAPVVLVAWGRRLEVQSASDPRIAQFVNAFADGPQAPEQGGYCTNGTGRPITP